MLIIVEKLRNIIFLVLPFIMYVLSVMLSMMKMINHFYLLLVNTMMLHCFNFDNVNIETSTNNVTRNSNISI
jgi:hypothetical protein